MRFDDVWIAGTGSVLGDLVPISTAVEDGSYDPLAAESTGMVSYSRAASAPAEMAVAAGRLAVKEAAALGVTTGPDTLHLHGQASFQGIEMWSAPCWIAGELLGTRLPEMPKAVSAWSNGSMAALDIAANALTARPELTTALVTVADRFAPPADRFHTSPGIVFGDGAAAAVLTRGGGRLRLLSHVAETDTVLGGLSRGDEPFRTAPPPERPDMRRRTREFLSRGDVSLRDVIQRTADCTRTVVARALADADVAPDGVDWLLAPYVGRTLYRDSFERPLDLEPRHTLAELGRTIGHLGSVDQLHSLDHLIGHDLLEPGQRLLLIGTGMGFTFSAAVLAADLV
ncbi:ketoacyl-ACP synthase III family protein [Streptomyces sp. NPDC048057]|uniref:ketoacyl-ACP synthase III family protein n=1 Tax=Streptomyces sp. NPDC048057 TaxID=3155628 RepID=UPI0033CA79D8